MQILQDSRVLLKEKNTLIKQFFLSAYRSHICTVVAVFIVSMDLVRHFGIVLIIAVFSGTRANELQVNTGLLSHDPVLFCSQTGMFSLIKYILVICLTVACKCRRKCVTELLKFHDAVMHDFKHYVVLFIYIKHIQIIYEYIYICMCVFK